MPAMDLLVSGCRTSDVTLQFSPKWRCNFLHFYLQLGIFIMQQIVRMKAVNHDPNTVKENSIPSQVYCLLAGTDKHEAGAGSHPRSSLFVLSVSGIYTMDRYTTDLHRSLIEPPQVCKAQFLQLPGVRLILADKCSVSRQIMPICTISPETA